MKDLQSIVKSTLQRIYQSPFKIIIILQGISAVAMKRPQHPKNQAKGNKPTAMFTLAEIVKNNAIHDWYILKQPSQARRKEIACWRK